MTFSASGDGPKTLSLAPIRESKNLSNIRSWASGPTKGIELGSEFKIFV
jgi:hypothetical protein